uniref:(R)-AMINE TRANSAMINASE n=2 Tax=unclassified Arthrobacter TaxID=235627 RepID=UPI00077534B7|nr:Chain A, (R)-AMINE TRANSAMINASE [Arthrobacter sp.]5FR9_B Chain B, (R)-AMINE TRANSAMINASE [Arthrobacter sp.]5FR9_C Chain C, (R)-AMINE TRANSAMINASE [Arthrobacter sp.]5FR9_D Chain D, (R)-AMINE TRANSAMINASE [Arthrobacter sp.]5FR9_E Chain E, (R)-AMINE TRANSAMINASE [Arthrobacter sp.]5FR9_F Chain F, (R)-AMINE TRANSAMINASE [Arthrobacter sp.]5FR9_G Chain G, (R)-AMINE TRANSAMINASE [Arthrobacter sp.]5FR9_H Chain H, (R)-AMINE TRANSAMINASE [Arthrobacter sp.]5FR9_I Chain I, (R)-AMINE TRANSAMINASE [Art
MAFSADTPEIVYTHDTGLDYITYSDYELDPANPLAGGAAWIEGAFVPPSEARISIFDQGFYTSDATYTTFHVWNGNAFRLGDHIERLFSNAESIRLIPPLTQDEVKEIALELVAKTELREAMVTVTITRGYSSTPFERDITKHRPQVYMSACPYQWIVPFDRIRDGVHLMVAQSVRRTPRSSIDPQVKNFQWGDLIRAIQETHDRGFELPLLLDCDNLLAEGPGFNVVVIKDGVVRSPGRAALPGITRKTVLEIAESLGHEAILADITPAELYDADEVLGCSTGGGVWPFVSVDGNSISDGVPGPVTQSIIRRYWELNVEPSSLLTPVQYALE